MRPHSVAGSPRELKFTMMTGFIEIRRSELLRGGRVSVYMRATCRVASYKEMAVHILSGAILGAILATALLATNRELAAVHAAHPTPQTFVLAVIVFSSSLFAVGSGITGFILSTLEKN